MGMKGQDSHAAGMESSRVRAAEKGWSGTYRLHRGPEAQHKFTGAGPKGPSGKLKFSCRGRAPLESGEGEASIQRSFNMGS